MRKKRDIIKIKHSCVITLAQYTIDVVDAYTLDDSVISRNPTTQSLVEEYFPDLFSLLIKYTRSFNCKDNRPKINICIIQGILVF